MLAESHAQYMYIPGIGTLVKMTRITSNSIVKSIENPSFNETFFSLPPFSISKSGYESRSFERSEYVGTNKQRYKRKVESFLYSSVSGLVMVLESK